MSIRHVTVFVQDLKQRGMFDDTLLVWGGEFGRTVYSQGRLTPTNYGRDHHPRCFTMWLAGAGVKGGVVHGETDDFSYNIVKDPVHVRDLQATILQSVRHRQRAIFVSIPGAGRQIDRRRRRGGREGHPRVSSYLCPVSCSVGHIHAHPPGSHWRTCLGDDWFRTGPVRESRRRRCRSRIESARRAATRDGSRTRVGVGAGTDVAAASHGRRIADGVAGGRVTR